MIIARRERVEKEMANAAFSCAFLQNTLKMCAKDGNPRIIVLLLQLDCKEGCKEDESEGQTQSIYERRRKREAKQNPPFFTLPSYS